VNDKVVVYFYFLSFLNNKLKYCVSFDRINYTAVMIGFNNRRL